jgi:uncharacterized protein
MAEIGKMNELRVVKELDFGIYLDGGEHGEILMPKRYVPEGCKPEDILNAFIYRDSEDRLIATTEKPYAMVGDFAFLKAVSVSTVGAFLDWGLSKDLMIPYREQSHKIEEGKKYVVHVYLDIDSQRIVASTKIDRFLDNLPPQFKTDEEVDLFIVNKTELGYKAIINSTHSGIIYQNEVFQIIKQGERLKGYIRKVREDHKIDLYLQKKGPEQRDELSARILKYLKENDGFMSITDKSNPEIIYKHFEVSKKTYKIAIGSLYKQRLIIIEDYGVRLA